MSGEIIIDPHPDDVLSMAIRQRDAAQADLDRERNARIHLAAGRDEARSDYNRLRTILLDTSRSDVAVRRRCLAIIATAGTPPVDMPLEARHVHRPGSCQCTPCKVAAAQGGAQ